MNTVSSPWLLDQSSGFRLPATTTRVPFPMVEAAFSATLPKQVTDTQTVGPSIHWSPVFCRSDQAMENLQ